MLVDVTGLLSMPLSLIPNQNLTSLVLSVCVMSDQAI